MNRGMPAFGVRARRSSSLSPNHRVSSFRGLPRKAAAPNAEPSRLRLAKPPPSKKRFAGEDLRSWERRPPSLAPQVVQSLSPRLNHDWPRYSFPANFTVILEIRR